MDEINDYDYTLPEILIASKPRRPRSSSKLLVFTANGIIDSKFFELTNFLTSKDRIVFNDTKVLKAKLIGSRIRKNDSDITKSRIEVLLSERTSENVWEVLCKPLKKVLTGDQIVFSQALSAKVISKTSTSCTLEFSKSGLLLDEEISKLGDLPLPPYILKKREYTKSDDNDYQTIFAKNLGAIAAPTASLHFDKKLMEELEVAKISTSYVTLHVGVGTFMPVKTIKISDHKMHAEKGIISKQVASEINQTIASGGRIIAVGTTCLRLIESATSTNGTVHEFAGKTNIFIKPGYKFKCVSGLITNFHLPKSTLLMLVSALVGMSERKKIYKHAISKKYRFYSYGDASLLLP